jgi:hypothetical protein
LYKTHAFKKCIMIRYIYVYIMELVVIELIDEV